MQITFGRYYAAGFATAGEKCFWGPLCCGENLPKKLFHKPNSPLDTINFAGGTRNISLKFEHTAPQNQDTLLAVELKNPRPALTVSGAPKEKPRPMNIPPKGIARNSDSYPCGLILLLIGPTKNSEELARTDNYHLPRKNASYNLVILHGHLWGGYFRCLRLMKLIELRGKAGILQA